MLDEGGKIDGETGIITNYRHKHMEKRYAKVGK